MAALMRGTVLPSRGMLIVVEGLDRSGKTSQCQRLQDRLEQDSIDARYVKFPDRSTPTGQMINSYLTQRAQQDDHSIHLLFSANRWEAVKSIQDDIAKGTVVIVDRYSFSGAVYSAAKDNPDLGLDWAWYPEIGLPKPDLLLFLDVSSEVAAKRGGYGEERYETQRMQERVRSLFEEVFERVEGLNYHKIDASGSMDKVTESITKQFALALQSSSLQQGLSKLTMLKPKPKP